MELSFIISMVPIVSTWTCLSFVISRKNNKIFNGSSIFAYPNFDIFIYFHLSKNRKYIVVYRNAKQLKKNSRKTQHFCVLFQKWQSSISKYCFFLQIITDNNNCLKCSPRSDCSFSTNSFSSLSFLRSLFNSTWLKSNNFLGMSLPECILNLLTSN